jgi:hypothetical protein
VKENLGSQCVGFVEKESTKRHLKHMNWKGEESKQEEEEE